MNSELPPRQPIPIKDVMVAYNKSHEIPRADIMGDLDPFVQHFAEAGIHHAISFSGGGARFPASLGVMRALIEENKVGREPTIAVGTSAGAIHAAIWNLVGCMDVSEWDTAVAEMAQWSGLYEGWPKITKPGKSLTALRQFSLHDFYDKHFGHFPRPSVPAAPYATFITTTKIGRHREPYLFTDESWRDQQGNIDPKLLFGAVECSASIPLAFRPSSPQEYRSLYDGGYNRYGLKSPKALSQIFLSQSGGQSVAIELKSDKKQGVYVEERAHNGIHLQEVTISLHHPATMLEDWKNIFLFHSKWYETGYEIGLQAVPYLS